MKITNLLFWTGLALMLVVGVMAVSQSHAAQTPVGTITTPSTGQTTLKAYNDSYVNPKLTIIGGNFDDIATGKADASCFATESAFNACFDLTWAAGGSMSWPASDGAYYAAKDGAWASLATVYQPLDSDLTTFSGLACTEGQIPKKNSSSVWVCGSDVEGAGGGISHATSDGNYYASRNGAWASLTGLFAAALGGDDNYATDAEKTKLANLSGTNSGDNAVNSNYSSLVTNATHTGDVTGSAALTIANNAVSLAKMADMATGSLIYRKTASTGDPEVQTLATLKTDLGLTGTNSGDQTTITGNAGTASALAANPTDCSAGQYATTIAANGNLTCAQVSYSQVGSTPTIPTVSDTAYDATSWNGNTDAPSKNAVRDKIETLGGGVSLSAANTWTATQSFSAGISTSAITSSAADGTHYADLVNGVAISATPTLGFISYHNGRMRLADGTDWDGYFLEDTDLGTGVGAMLAIAPGSAGGPTTTIASGTSALGTGAISSGACASVVTTSATGTATTDVINWGFNSSPAAVTGYVASANGMLTIIAYPSSGNVNFLVCNNTAASITPGAVTLNWRIQR